jgi:hypothetical protein
LSVYYVFLWNPKDVPHRTAHLGTPTPISPPGTVCPQSAGASLQEQENIEGRNIKSFSVNFVSEHAVVYLDDVGFFN